MADGDHFGLTESNVLAAAANGHEDHSLLLMADLKALIADMEADAGAMAGNQLAEFRRAKARFIEAFETLAAKNGLRAAELGEIHRMGANTEADAETGYARVGTSIPAINTQI